MSGLLSFTAMAYDGTTVQVPVYDGALPPKVRTKQTEQTGTRLPGAFCIKLVSFFISLFTDICKQAFFFVYALFETFGQDCICVLARSFLARHGFLRLFTLILGCFLHFV